jgi:hypothetical protein
VKLDISNHAIKRYRERIGPLPESKAEARGIMRSKLARAKPKYLKRLRRKKRTAIIPIPDEGVIFVGSFGNIVTVLDKLTYKEQGETNRWVNQLNAKSSSPTM